MKQSSNSVTVSVVIPTYNGSRFIEQTIDSVLKQDYEKVELIVIDDCSTDNTFSIVQAMKKNDSTNRDFQLLRNQENQGLMKTNNIAAKQCCGDFLLFLGHDDLLSQNHISQLVNDLDREVVMLWCNSFVINENGEVVATSLKNHLQLIKNKFSRPMLMFANYISSTGAIIRKSTFVKVGGFSEQFRNFGEWTLWIQLAAQGDVRFSTKGKAYYRRHGDNMTSDTNVKKSKTVLDDYYSSARALAESSFNLNMVESIFSSIYKSFHSVKKALLRHTL